MDGIIYTIIIGAVCGYIADVLMSDNGYGLLVSIIIGIAGSFVGTWAFGELGIKTFPFSPTTNNSASTISFGPFFKYPILDKLECTKTLSPF